MITFYVLNEAANLSFKWALGDMKVYFVNVKQDPRLSLFFIIKLPTIWKNKLGLQI